MTNKFNQFIREGSNVSKIRKWDTIDRTHSHKSNWDSSDFYFVYDLKKEELGKYLNTWFVGRIHKSKDDTQTYTDEMITLKKVDSETADNLYRRKYNPLSIRILCPPGARFKQNDLKQNLYNMKAQLHSIDDSQYGIWWDDFPFSELESIRLNLMKWIDSISILNGEEFLNKCVELGADVDSKDYN